MKKVLAMLLLLASASAGAAAPGEDVEVTAGVVTGIDCALQARTSGDLKLLNACAPAEAKKELVVFDVAE
jgi:hypothetical protein